RRLIGLDVQLITGQLAGQTDILAVAADGDAQLIFRYDDTGFRLGAVDNDISHLGGTQCILDVGNGVGTPDDDIDLFLFADFTHHSIDAGAMSANECTDRIDALHIAVHRNFAAHAGFTSNTLDFYGATFHFRHLSAEKPFDKLHI